MTIADYQKQIDDWMQRYDPPYWTPLSQFARLAEELGELGRVLNHTYGQKVKKTTEEADDLEGEVGDVLFGLLCLANSQKIDMDAAIQGAIKKAQTRDKDRYTKKKA